MALYERTRPLWLLLVVGCALYANSLSNPFVFDDHVGILKNESIRQLLPANAETRGLPTDGRPLVRLSFAISYALSGYDVAHFRVVNLALHILCSWLCWAVLRPVLSDGKALVVALVWLIHPLNSECINYISQRSEQLMALCYLAALYAAQRAARGRNCWVWECASVVSCAAGMACKESMVTAPVLIALYDRVYLFDSWRAAWRQRRRIYAGFMASWLLLAVLVAEGPRGDTAGWGLQISPFTYALIQSDILVDYLRSAFWPHPLLFDYGFAGTVTVVEVWPQLLSIALLLAMSGAALYRQPRVGFAAVGFFILLSPTSSIVPIVTEVGAERRMYLPLIPLIALVVSGIHALWHSKGWSVSIRNVVLSVVVAGFSGLTVKRNAEYSSELSIWQATLAVAPDNPRIYNNIARLSTSCEQVTMHFRRAIELSPEWVLPQKNLARAFNMCDEADSAVSYFRSAIRLDARDIETNAGLCEVLIQGQYAKEAVEACRQTVELDPWDMTHHIRWGQALRLAGQSEIAERVLLDALKLGGERSVAYYELGFLHNQMDRLDEAEKYYRTAIREDSTYFAALYNLGVLLKLTGREGEGAQLLRAAQHAAPDLWQRVRNE